MDYAICRISKPTQNIERQVRNITAIYPNAYVVREAYTGTKLAGRKEFEKVLKSVKPGDRLIFDSASRMSRNAEEAIELYEKLFADGIELVFLKEPHINTEVYRSAIEKQIAVQANTGNTATDNFIDSIIEALNRYSMELAKEQIKLVFQQAQKEVDDLHQRTAEGILTAKLNGKQIGRETGAKITTKKSVAMKEKILKHSKDFGGSLTDKELMEMTGLARNTYYKYKAELKNV